MIYEKKKVSEDAAKILDHVSGVSIERMEVELEKAESLADEMGFSRRRCMMWGGCYYCNDGGGWYLVYCIA